jgi:hypothetical protein
MRLTVLEYIRLQVDYNKKMEQIWANLIPQLERVQLDPNANVVGETAGGPGPGSTNGTGARQPGGEIVSAGASPPPPLQATGPGPQIHSQPMINNNMPNPQQAYMQATPNPFMSQSMGNIPSAQPQIEGQIPGMLSVQYREAPSGGF